MQTETEKLADRLAYLIFPHNHDRQRREDLAMIFKAFAAEIKRSAIEP